MKTGMQIMSLLSRSRGVNTTLRSKNILFIFVFEVFTEPFLKKIG